MVRGDKSGRRQLISFDTSAIDAFVDYLKNRSNEKFERLISTYGSKFAYKHHLWSSASSALPIREFWRKELEEAKWSEQLETSIAEIPQYLVRRKEEWLGAVLSYLPRGHVFNTTVYLIGGYDSVVYGENVALNLNFKQYHLDHREAVYYLIHELAHAGYFRYRRMPNLANIKTLHDLLDSVKLLTHLEGMGIISPFKLRLKEGGLSDADYNVLLNQAEREARVKEFFSKLSNLEKQTDRTRKMDYHILEDFSSQPKRLWYITGGHMALKIEQKYGTSKLQGLVRKGPGGFFGTYGQIENPL